MGRAWGKGNTIGLLYRLTKNDLKHRIGNSWMEGRLRVGDVVLCLAHSGDCFFDYALIKEGSQAIELIPESRFGAYSLSTPLDFKLTTKEYHLLMAEELVYRPLPKADKETP